MVGWSYLVWFWLNFEHGFRNQMSRSNSDQVNSRLRNKKVKSDLHQTETKLVHQINKYFIIIRDPRTLVRTAELRFEFYSEQFRVNFWKDENAKGTIDLQMPCTEGCIRKLRRYWCSKTPSVRSDDRTPIVNKNKSWLYLLLAKISFWKNHVKFWKF